MLGDLVRAHRVRLGLTQEELAERAGVSPRSIRNIENGRTALPRASTVRLLAAAFGLTGPEYTEFCQTRAVRAESEPLAAAVRPRRENRLPPDLPDYTGNEAIVAAVSAALTAAPSGTRGLPAVV